MALFPAKIRKALHAVRHFLLGNQLTILPLRTSLVRYNGRRCLRDVAAGTNVALMAIPQGMAYALMAGLDNVAYGITCSAVAAFLAAFFSTSRFTILGPTNATALLLFSALAGRSISAGDKEMLLPILIFLAGIILVAGAYLRMADFIQYISRSVMVGYLTGSAFLIMAGQLREVLGIPASPAGSKARSFFSILGESLWRLREVRWQIIWLSLGTLALYLLLRRFARKLPAFALTLVGMSLISAVLEKAGWLQGVPHVAAFDFGHLIPHGPDLRDARMLDQVMLLIGPAMALAFLAALESSVMGKSLAGRCGDRFDANQDMLSVGIANLGAAFVSHMPASGSLMRSTLNFESGAATQVSSIVCGLLCAAGALCLGSAVSWIPLCSLAMLMVCIAFSLLNRRNLRICLRATKSDATTLIVTATAALIAPLHVAIFVGVATSVMLYLRKASRPMLVEYEFNPEGDLKEKAGASPRQNPQISIVHVEGELFFGAAELFRNQIQRTVVDPSLRVIILRMKNARHLDATSVMALEDLIKFLHSKHRHLIISGASKEVYRVLRNAGMVPVIGRENIFMGSGHNPNLSTRNALKRAQQLLGTTKADIRIFFDPQRPQE
ncbi:MAG: SulP family inorganic anion transporter [Verrucomicrobiales bacterium]|nr:SulP family inorganic anion transporter [Verrucomicrobiales bacterium]